MATWILFLLAPVLAGLLGGFINHLIEVPPKSSPNKEPYKWNWFIFGKWAIYGIVAGAVVPVYLRFTESAWYDEIFAPDNEKISYVYFGLVALVALFPTSFLAAMIGKINKIDEVSRKIDDLNSDLKELRKEIAKK